MQGIIIYRPFLTFITASDEIQYGDGAIVNSG